ncbi:MAG: N-acetylmuramic acid 6-phosphate etherase [Phycisphaera sp.]|nr:N-acetylmuramic acid 6-phosphate etherase [Phycisphaera sp.]
MTNAHPPDRSHLNTERRNPRTMDLHRQPVADIVRTIQREDRAVLDAMDGAADALAALIAAIEPRFARGGRLVYLGAGTSGRLGVLDASEAPPTFQVDPGRVVGIIAGGDPALRKSSEGMEDDPAGAIPQLDTLALTADDTVIGIASGGTTPYVLGALAHAASLTPAPLTAMITCTPIDTPPGVDHLVLLDTGPEVLTGSTRMKAGTATKLALNTISTTLMIRTGRVYENLMVDLRATNNKLRDRAARIVSMITGLDRDAAFALLDAAGGSVKAAAVMHRRGVDRAEAESLLAARDGVLHLVLDEE